MNTETEIANLIDIKTLDWADVRVLSLVNSLNIDHKAVVRPLMDRIAWLEKEARLYKVLYHSADAMRAEMHQAIESALTPQP